MGNILDDAQRFDDAIAAYEFFNYIYTSRFPYIYSQLNLKRFLVENSDLTIKAYFNYIDNEIFNPVTVDEEPKYEIKHRALDLEIQHSILLDKQKLENQFIYGLNFRMNNTKSNLYKTNYQYPYKKYSFNQLALFWQKQAVLWSGLALHYGERYDVHKNFGFLRSPRMSLVFLFFQHSIRLSFSKAFRTPSMFESYVDYEGLVGGLVEKETISDSLNSKLKPESIISFQFSFQRIIPLGKNGFTYGIDLYYNKLTDLINTVMIKENKQEISPIFRFSNIGKSNAYGGELNLDYRTSIIDFFFNVSYIQIKDNILTDEELINSFPNIVRDDELDSIYGEYNLNITPLEVARKLNEYNKRSPKLKFNSGLNFHYNNLSLSISQYFVSETKNWVDFFSFSLLESSSYSLVDMSMAYKFKAVSLSFYVKNLFNYKHYEYPENQYNYEKIGMVSNIYLLGLEQSEKIGRIFTFNLKVEF